MDDASQFSRQLSEGMFSAFEAVAQRNRERAELAAMREESELNQWKAHADEWKVYGGQMAAKNNELLAFNAKLVETVKDLYIKNQTSEKMIDNARELFSEYSQVLISRIRKLDQQISRESANSFAVGKMRDRLTLELSKLQDPSTCELLDPVKQLALHEQDWNDFLDNAPPAAQIPGPGGTFS